MENESQVPKRNISIAAAVAMLLVGSVALLFSKVRARRKVKAQAKTEELNKSSTD